MLHAWMVNTLTRRLTPALPLSKAAKHEPYLIKHGVIVKLPLYFVSKQNIISIDFASLRLLTLGGSGIQISHQTAGI